MNRRGSQSGFTLLEILVASMLMAMLITILTMVFNSSSIAWNTGKANITEMDSVRRKMSVATIQADNAVPGVEVDGQGKVNVHSWGYVVGPWDEKGELRQRAVIAANDQIGTLTMPQLKPEKGTWLYKDKDELWATLTDNVRAENKRGNARDCVVGVWSYGPDGRPNTGDDISTWPDAD